MLQNYNRYKLLKIFLYSPTTEFRLRELARLSKISPVSVINYLNEFQKEELIKKDVKEKIPFYKAQRDNKDFILYKKMSILYEINFSGLIEHIWEKASPDAIILYGSYSKGESTENSDLDLFIIGKEIKLDLKEFEKKLNRNIHIIFEKNPKNIQNELKNNLINGIVLKGYFKAI